LDCSTKPPERFRRCLARSGIIASMDALLAGRTAVVTGAARGIGRAAAEPRAAAPLFARARELDAAAGRERLIPG